jgi:hypothetical protein
MPDFRLTSYGERILYDSRDYIVTAETREAAAEMLAKAQAEVDAGGRPISDYPGIRCISCSDEASPGLVLPLRPEVVVDEDSGVVEVNPDGDVVWTLGHDEATRLRNVVGHVLASLDKHDGSVHANARAPNGHDYVALWSIVQQLRTVIPST